MLLSKCPAGWGYSEARYACCRRWSSVSLLEGLAGMKDSPLDVEPMAIKDIGVWGTVLGGQAFPAD